MTNMTNMTNPDPDPDSDWEYEYSPTSTSTFYLPLDLTNVASAQIPPAVIGRPGHPTLLKSRLRALNAQRGLPIEIPVAPSDSNEPPTMGELQIAGLHTPEPLVAYNGHLLSCEWNQVLGTEMFFAKPVAAKTQTETEKPLRALPEVDLIASCAAKLIARDADLLPREDLVDQVMLDDEGKGVAKSVAGDARQNQTSFLEKLNQVRARKGLRTRLTWVETAQGSHLRKVRARRGGGRGSRGGRGGRGGARGRGAASSQLVGDTAMGGA